MAPVVLYDANVLYPSTLRDVLLRVGLARLVTPRWTDQILDEVFRNLSEDRPDLDPARLGRTRALMNAALPDVLVIGYEHRIHTVALPDTDDRHVLAAAIHAGAALIVTKNLRDFPVGTVAAHGIAAQHPDAFLLALCDRAPDRMSQIVRDIAATWHDDENPAHVLKSLAGEAPNTAAAIERDLARPDRTYI